MHITHKVVGMGVHTTRTFNSDDDCRAGRVQSRGRVWESGLEIYFRVPDWGEGVAVTASVGPGITEVDKCWGILEGSVPTLDGMGNLNFQLGPAGRSVDPDVVGCILMGQLLNPGQVEVQYHGPHCYSHPPPPPAVFEDCPGGFKLAIASLWGGGEGWTARVLMPSAEWRGGRHVRILPPATNRFENAPGTVGTAIIGASSLSIREVFNAQLLGNSRLALDFILLGDSQSSCGDAADAAPGVSWACFTFHAQPAPDADEFVAHSRIVCPTVHPVAPPPSAAPRPPPPPPPPPSPLPFPPPPPSPPLGLPSPRAMAKDSPLPGSSVQPYNLDQPDYRQPDYRQPAAAPARSWNCPMDRQSYIGVAVCAVWDIVEAQPVTCAIAVLLVLGIIFLTACPASGQRRGAQVVPHGKFHGMRKKPPRRAGHTPLAKGRPATTRTASRRPLTQESDGDEDFESCGCYRT